LTEPREGWWSRYGFASLGDYLIHLRTGPDRPGSLKPPRRTKNLSGAKPPREARPNHAPGPLARTRQVSIRLDDEAYADLVKAARLYGVAPATMGRLLVAKGAKNAVGES
jgi:hypothetical protein